MDNFLHSLTICLLHCYPRHVSSINMLIFRRKNCIHTASLIFVLCERLHSTLRADCSPLSTSVLCRRSQRTKIPDAVWVQFFLLKMGMLMLETCREWTAVRSQLVYCAGVHREQRYQMLCEYNFSSWRWAC